MKIFTLAFWSLLPFLCFAQEFILTGTVLQDDEKPIEFANVYFTQDSAVEAGSFSESDGSFEIKLKPGSYTFHVSYIGYEDFQESIRVDGDRDFGKLQLEPDSEQLDEILVTEFRNEMKAGIDKKTIHISEGLRRSNPTVSELLEMMPIINMDMEGIPSVPGKMGVVILVDGRPPKMRADNIATVLRMIPTDQVISVEIMTNPPAKYTKGNEAVINIVTTRAPQKGSLLNLRANADDQEAYGGGLSHTLKNGNFSNSLWMGKWGHNNDGESSWTQTNTFQTNQYRQEGISNSEYKGYGFYGGVAPEFEFNNKLIISPYIGLWDWNNDNLFQNQLSIYSSGMELEDVYNTSGDNFNGGRGYFGGLEVFKYFNEDEKELSLDFGINIDKRESIQDQILQGNQYAWSQFTTTKSTSTNLSLDIEFFDPIDSSSNYSVDFEIDTDLPAESITSHFSGATKSDQVFNDELSYLNTIGSFSQELSLNYSKTIAKTSFALDLGQEYFKYLNTFDGLDVKTDYLLFIPKVVLSQKIGESNQIGLSYKYSSQVPYHWYINPNITVSTDSLEIRYGNPNLDVVRSHDLELNYSFFLGKFNIGATAFRRDNRNSISPYSFVNEDGIRERTHANIGSLRNTGASASINGAIAKRIKVNLSGSVYGSKISNPGQVDRNTTGYNLNGRVDFVLPKDLKLSFNSRYQGPELGFQGFQGKYGTIGASLRKGFLENRLNVNINYNDILRSSKHTEYAEGPGFVIDSQYQRFRAQFGLRVSYRIGELKDKPRSSKSQ